MKNFCEFTVFCDGDVEFYCSSDSDKPPTSCKFYSPSQIADYNRNNIRLCKYQTGEMKSDCNNDDAKMSALSGFYKRIKSKLVWVIEPNEIQKGD